MATTEMVILPLKEGLDPHNTSDDSSKVLKQTCQTLTETPGCQKVRYGTALEDPSALRLLIDWDSLAKHKEFMASDRYQPFLANIRSILSGPPKIQHVDFSPHSELDKVLASPVTEIVNIHFEGDVPAEYAAGWEEFKAATVDAKGNHGAVFGPTYETLEYEGVKGQAAALAIGWDSKDAHMAFRETEPFKKHIHLLRSTSKKSFMQHVHVTTYQA